MTDNKIDGGWAQPWIVNEQRDPWPVDDQKALCPWLIVHGLDPKIVPYNTWFVFVDDTCSVQVFRHECGRLLLVDDAAAEETVTFDVHDPFPLATP